MMAQKHLRELLKEDQEPFLLKNYIADRRSQLQKSTPKPKPKPIINTSISKHNTLFKQACFFSFQNSPDVRKSPLIDFPETPKSPCKSPNNVLLHIPARTAALLLDAAMRIHKQSSSNSKPKTQIKNAGFGFFDLISKRFSSKIKTRNREIGGVGASRGFARKSGGKGEKVKENAVDVDGKSGVEMSFSFSCNNSRRNSTFWSESNEEKSMDLESCSSGGSSSSSSRSEDLEEVEERQDGDFAFCDESFCSSPLSPFRFALHTSPSPGRRTPVFSSPATSPSRPSKQEENSEVVESTENIHLVEEEEEKEQFSPVSVLDPPFEDDDDDDDNGGNEEGIYDLECSYAIVQRAKRQLLHKLHRFEKLAELDPIELEKRMLEEQDDDDESEYLQEEDEFDEAESLSSHKESDVDWFVSEVLSKSGFHLSKDMKRLVSDLIAEEERVDDGTNDRESVAKRVCKRLDSWKEEQSNTIDMMVELDFRREADRWKKSNKEQVREAAMEIELSIFGLLLEELAEELVFLPTLVEEGES